MGCESLCTGSNVEIHCNVSSSHRKVAVDAQGADFFERLKNSWQGVLGALSTHKLRPEHSEGVYSQLAQWLRQVSDKSLSVVNELLPSFGDSDSSFAMLQVVGLAAL